MRLKPLSRPQKEVLEAIAHFQIVAELSANVDGMEKFREFYRERVITRKQNQIFEEYKRTVVAVKKRLTEMLKEENGRTD
ncbi:hypothetical protein FHP88_15665 [Sedimenticola selenatireducens]|uniref:Uncharacterized protein n=1 Tax=Sedimenticola selenatireducens TaxID=191960 RepID=A0A557S0C5_9GAMM|nr:hypothetical protein [Sedimenticola selenatireducens]TVO70890.1 hypothetical protein FHP88_15665 [Sedimenticola selenatireducens]